MANVAPPIDEVFQAIHALYNDPNPQEKEKASDWLGKFQKSLHSWQISDELLQQKRSVESCYFGAQTMRSKIQHSFHELPIEAHISLRDSLLEHISRVTPATNAVIVTQLSLALADLALQMTLWSSPIADLVERYSASNAWGLLEILTVIPEEVMSRSLRLGANRRNEIKQYLTTNSSIVCEFLRVTLDNSLDNSLVTVKIIKCLTSWLSINAIASEEIVKSSVISHTFQVLQERSTSLGLHEAASDCICVLLKNLEEKTENNIEILTFHSVVSLEPSYHLAVAHEDQEKAINYSRIFTELGESFLEKIVNFCPTKKENQHFAIKSLDLVLVCVGHHDYEVAEISFNLWYRLSEELYNRENEELISVFKPYAERLIGALCRHCQMEPDHQGLLDKDDEFYDFRQKALDLTKDMVFTIGSSHCFQQMFISLQVPNVSWEQTEAVLFFMQAIAKNILPEEYEVVPKVVEAILSLPDSAHVAVRYTSVLLLGELCEWIDKHPECLQATLECILRALQHVSLAPAAAHALQGICSACRDHMGVHLSGLLQIIHSLDSLCLSSEASINVLRGVAAIIGRLPHEQVTVAMREACSVQLTALATLSAHNVAISKETTSDPTLWLDRLSALFRYCKLISLSATEIHPCLVVFTEAWPILSAAMERYCEDLRIMERLCRCLRFAIRSLGRQASILLEPLSKQMVLTYNVHRHSCFLYLASILVDEFAGEPTCNMVLTEMLQTLIGPSFELLMCPSGLSQNPDTVDDLFRLCLRFLQKLPLDFLNSSAIEPVIKCGLQACSLDHRDANSSVMKFFCDLVHVGQPKGSRQDCIVPVMHLLSSHGEAIVANLTHASVFCIHSYMLSDVSEVLLEMLLLNRSQTILWIENALKKLPQNGTFATSDQLQQFHSTVSRSQSGKEITQALRDFARLYN